MSSDNILTFYGDPDLKQALVDRLTYHQIQDAYVQGSYVIPPWSPQDESGNLREEVRQLARGCAMGCSLLAPGATGADVQALHMEKSEYPGDWSGFAGEAFGLSEEFTDSEEAVFENVDSGDAKLWPLRLVQAVPVGIPIAELEAAMNEVEATFVSPPRSNELKFGIEYWTRYAEHMWGLLRLLDEPEDPYSNSVTVPRREPDNASEEATKVAIGI